jgi:protein dithiol:quinone oxidoreductase
LNALIAKLPSRRICYLLGFLLCAGLVGYALFLQYYKNEEPCPLCIFQRVAVMALGLVFLVAAIHNPLRRGAIVYGVMLLLVAGIGASIAGRHVWLQNLPKDQVPECGPGLNYMLDAFPLGEVVAKVLRGSGECAEAGKWRFLGLTIPGWTLIAFIGMGIGGLIQIWNRPHARKSDG